MSRYVGKFSLFYVTCAFVIDVQIRLNAYITCIWVRQEIHDIRKNTLNKRVGDNTLNVCKEKYVILGEKDGYLEIINPLE
jgi:hypothetical protein